MEFSQGENHLFFRADGRLLISRKIDANFPAYERVIPKTNDKQIEFDRDRLAAAVRRVRLLSNERSKAVKFVIGKDQVEITSSTPEVGEAHEVLPVEYGGGAMQICFNADYVDNFLSVVETEGVQLEFKDEMSQAVDETDRRRRLRLHLRDHADADLNVKYRNQKPMVTARPR